MRELIGLLVLLWACAETPARAEWLRAESPNFIVYSEGSEARLRERILLLEDFDRLLRLLTSGSAPPPENKLHTYILPDHAALAEVRPVPPGISGFYVATPHGTAALVDGGSEGRGTETLFHEYAHHFMMRSSGAAYPAWYVEGFADYLASARFTRRHIDVGIVSPGRGHSLLEGRWLPMARILSGDTTGLEGEQMAMFYAQSWLATHYFFSTPERKEALLRYLAAVAEGNSQGALQAANGMSPDEFGDELRRYIRTRRVTASRLTRTDQAMPPPPVTVTRLPRSAGDLMTHAVTLTIGVQGDEAEFLDSVRTAAARHGGDPFARRVLARAEALYGDGAAADRLLDPLLEAAPGDAELMYLKGMRHLRAAEDGDENEARTARQWFTRAHAADGNHYQTLYRFAETLRGERAYRSENTRNVMLLAVQLAPQVAEIRLNAAALLIDLGEAEDAEALLRPLAANPHEPQLAEIAQRLIGRARASGARAAADAEDVDEAR